MLYTCWTCREFSGLWITGKIIERVIPNQIIIKINKRFYERRVFQMLENITKIMYEFWGVTMYHGDIPKI